MKTMPSHPVPDEPLGIQRVHAVLDWVDYPAERGTALAGLTAYHDWLAAEALPAGGIGPGEGSRIWRRHIADSLTFLAGLGDATDILDVGSGVGLPGIPVALALPDARLTLLDRSERRCDLARRAVRVLRLGNVYVIHGDARTSVFPHEAAVSRAFEAVAGLAATLRRLLPNGAVAVVAGSHGASAPPVSDEFEIIRVPADVLGESTWLAKVSLSG